MIRIRISYEDGRYGFRRVETDGDDVIEVAESTVKLWEAVSRLEDVVNAQLRDLDNAWYEKREKR